MPRNNSRGLSRGAKVSSVAAKSHAILILKVLVTTTALFAVLLTCLMAYGANDSQNQILSANVSLRMPDGTTAQSSIYRTPTAADLEQTVPVIAGSPFNAEISFDGTNFNVKVNGSSVITIAAVGSPNGKVGFIIKKGTASFGEIGVQ